ncbi:MAG: cell division protein ZapD [Gammaproteobacteria bacterium]|nr:cell division protein ZapD [Gammaproteobacteria bacterium]MDH5629899.1 cell division protein ZapD [Gammaproteobacteria bacterium]
MTKENEKTDLFSLYEFPLNEKTRRFLKLEHLFKQLENSISQIDQSHIFIAFKYMFEIMDLFDSADCKSDLIKELGTVSGQYHALNENPAIDAAKLTKFLQQVDSLHQWLINYKGKFGESLRSDPLIDVIRYRAGISGGINQFECPEFFLFINQDELKIKAAFSKWLSSIEPIFQSIGIILKLLRDNDNWKDAEAPMGNYIIETTNKNYQLLQIKLPKNNLLPVISYGKHRSNINFMNYNISFKKSPCLSRVTFHYCIT